MEIKSIQPIHVLYFETQTSLREISEHVRIVARRLYQDAVKNELEITGPVYWIYEGADGQPDTKFSLTIALPVTPDETRSSESMFQLKYLEPFECVAGQLYGSWDKLGDMYGNLISALSADNLTMSGQNREIYLNMDFQHPERNITEVQIGIRR
jgi:effector-binding domain-containing protein